MSHNAFDQNCHGIPLDVWLTLDTRMRWSEVREMFNDDHEPPICIVQVDQSWIGSRSFENMTINDRERYNEQFFKWKAKERPLDKKTIRAAFDLGSNLIAPASAPVPAAVQTPA